jgi:HAD superfamily hydrolase (TIGR01509 family)
VIIFDCNGVLVDSEPIATAVVVQEFRRAGFEVSPEVIARYFVGRRPADMFATLEAATGRKLPRDFATTVTIATLRRFREELKPTPHIEHALAWLRGPKCVASSSTLDRVRVSLETTGLIRFFDRNMFSAADVPRGKPAPDLFLHVAAQMGVSPKDCVVVEDSPAGVSAAAAAGMTPIGFVGGSHAGHDLGSQLTAAGARAVVADMRALKGVVSGVRGW